MAEVRAGRAAPVAALVLNACVWGISWWPFRQLEARGLHPLWATVLIYALAVVIIVALRPRAAGQVLRTPALWVLIVASGTTNAAPQPKVEAVWPSGQTGLRPGCESGDCQYIAYRLSNYQGNIVCTIDSSDGAFDTKDDGLNGRYDPHNGDNVSHKFFGFPGGWVTVSCTGSNGSDSFTRNPWGG